jgi:hypothetical protein
VSLTQYYTATLDGFIADPNDSLDWLFTRQRDERDRQLWRLHREVCAGDGVDDVRVILDHEFRGKDQSEWSGPTTSRAGFTHRKLAVVPDAKVEFTSGDVAPVQAEVEAAGEGTSVVGGASAGQFADAGLLDEVIN